MLRRMYDASQPSEITDVPQWEAVALYIGGNTPHVATDREWQDQIDKSGARWKLPIYTRSNPDQHDPRADALAAAAWCSAHKVDKGAAVGLDLETAVNPRYVTVFNTDLLSAGWRTLAYGSKSTLFKNPRPSAGYWVADYTGKPHLFPGCTATQWSDSTPFRGQYDPNVIADSLLLWRVPLSLTKEDQDWINGQMSLWATRIVQAVGGRHNVAFNSENTDMDNVLSLQDIRNDIKAPPTVAGS